MTTTRTGTPQARRIISVEMPHDLYKALGKRAAEEERSMAALVRLAIRTYIEGNGK